MNEWKEKLNMRYRYAKSVNMFNQDEKAIANGLEGEDLERVLLGLGSTYRCVGEYEKSYRTLKTGTEKFPENRGMEIFLALTMYNLNKHPEAMEIVIRNLVETTSDDSIKCYGKALTFYSVK